MRRAERRLADAADVWKAVEDSRWMVVSLVDGASPYATPVLFAVDAGCIYVHGAHEGRKAGLLSRGADCCCVFVPEAQVKPAPEGAPCCAFSLRYRSVVAFGVAEAVDDQAEASRVADLFCERYGAGGRRLGDGAVAATGFWRIRISEMSGKAANAGAREE